MRQVVQTPGQTSVPPTLGASVASASGGSLVQPSSFVATSRTFHPQFPQQPTTVKHNPQHGAIREFLGVLGITDPPVTLQTVLNALTPDEMALYVKRLSEHFPRATTPQCVATIPFDGECGSLVPTLLATDTPLTPNDIQQQYLRSSMGTASDHPRTTTGQAYTPHGQDKGRRVNHPGPTRGGYSESRTVSPHPTIRPYSKGGTTMSSSLNSYIGPEESHQRLRRPISMRMPIPDPELVALCHEGKSAVYDPSVRIDSPNDPIPDDYKSDDDPGYRCLALHSMDPDGPSQKEWRPLYDWEEVRYWKRKPALQEAHRLNDTVHKAPLRASSNMDDELMAAAASPAQTAGQTTPQMSSSDARFASSIGADGGKRENKSSIWPPSDSQMAANGRELSPTFGGRGEDDSPTHNSPTSAGGIQLHQSHTPGSLSTAACTAEGGEPQQYYVEVMGVNVDRQQARRDAENWRREYSNGKHSAHREQRRKYRDSSPSHRLEHLKSDHPIFTHTSGPQLDCFCLKVIYEQDRTGFQEDEDFKDDLGTYVAGRYKINQHLGSAAFSKVYRCYDEHENRSVCLKMIDAKKPENKKDYLDQSLDEIQLLRYLQANSPDKNPSNFYCINVFDWFYYKEHLFIVTELLGDNLYTFDQKMLKLVPTKRFFTLGRIQKIAYQILVCLSFIHPLRLIHCDLKPENILIFDEKEPLVKVIDFGSSCFEDDKISVYVQSRSYRAPEVLLGLAYDQKIDLWSLGCILAELWTGYVLFQNRDVQSMLARIVGILGPLPYYMVAASPIATKYFTEHGQLQRLVTRPDRPPEPEALFPKKTSLRQRMRCYDEDFLDFLTKLLSIDPVKRIDARQALRHPFMAAGKYADGLQQ